MIAVRTFLWASLAALVALAVFYFIPGAMAQSPIVGEPGFSMDKILKWLENASPFAAGLSIYLWLRSDAERKAVQGAKDAQSIQMLTSVEKFADALENTQKIVDKAATGIDVMNRIILERLPQRSTK